MGATSRVRTMLRASAAWLLGNLALMFVATSAHAQAAAPQSIDQIVGASPAGDKSIMMLTQVLGGFFSNPFSAVGGPTTLLGSIFVVFNGAFFIIAVFWGTWNILRGIVSTAHEGQLLGRSLNAVWLPIRMVTGIAGIVPVFGGFNLGQAVMAFAAAVGIGVANLMWTAALTLTQQFTASLNPAIAAPTTGLSFRQAAYAQFAVEVCALAKTQQEAEFASSGSPVAPTNLLRAVAMNPPTDLLAFTKYGTETSPNLCGHVALYRREARSPNTLTGDFRVAAVQYRNIAASVQDGYAAAHGAFAQAVRQEAAQWYQARLAAQGNQNAGIVPVPTDRLDQLAIAYATAAQKAAAAAVASGANDGAIANDVLQKMKADGWAAAGAWYATFAEVNAAITDAVRAVEIRVAVPQQADNTSLMAEASAALNKSIEVGKAASAKPAEGDSGFSVVKAIMGDALGLGGTNATGEWSFGQVLVEKAIGATAANSGGNGLTNPIIMFKNMGDWLMVAGESLHVAIFAIKSTPVGGALADSGGVASAATSIASKIPFAGAAVNLAQSLLAILPMLATVMIVLGAIMAIYIPMVPFLTWMGGLVQYMVVIVEGLAAMTLGALAHMEAEGEGMGGRTERTYVFFLNVIGRPACMLIGFFTAAALVTALGTFQTWLFMGALANAQGNSLTGLVTIIGMLIIFFIMNWTLIQGLFNLIFIVPDNVIGYLGNSSNAHLGQEVENKVHGLFLGATRRLDGGTSALAGLARERSAGAGAAAKAGASQAAAGQAAGSVKGLPKIPTK